MFKNLTLTLALRYEYYTPVSETDGLALIPRLENGNPIQTLLDPNAILDFASGNTGRPLYKSDRNNFAPNVGSCLGRIWERKDRFSRRLQHQLRE